MSRDFCPEAPISTAADEPDLFDRADDPDDADERLVERIRAAPAGDTRDFEALVLRHQARIVANCRYLTSSGADSEDLAQEVFVKAFFAMPRFEGRSRFKTWLQRIKINHCLNYLRKREGRTFVAVDDPIVQPAVSVAPTAERRLESADDRDRIQLVLDRLSDTLRIPLLLRDADGLSYEEIAEQLDIGLSAVKMRIKRGREEFRRLFDESPRSAGTEVSAGPTDEGADPP